MLKLDRSVLPVHLKSLVRQMVENGYLNITTPVTGRADYWANFFDGHPDRCQLDKHKPFVFMYGLQMQEEQVSISDKESVRITATIGVHAWCENMQGLQDKVEEIWWHIRYAFSMSSGRFTLPGVYTIDNISVSGASLGDLGISSAEVIGDSLQINTDQMWRYSAQVQFLCYFNAFRIHLQDNSNKTITIS